MKKKGFTLVELLAVVVILGVIFMFIVPRLSTLIKKGEKSERDILEERVLIAAKEYVSNNNRNFYDVLVNEGDYNYIYRTDLLKSGLVDENELKALGDNLVGVKGELLDNDKIKYTLTYIDNPVNGYCEDEVYLMIQQLQDEIAALKSGSSNTGSNTGGNTYNSILDAYPVGSIYTSVTSTNPGEIFGGTWESFGSGKTLVGVDTTDDDFKIAGKTGGSKSVGYTPSGTVGGTALTVAQLPSHNHSIPALSGSTNSAGSHSHRTFIAINNLSNTTHSTREWEAFIDHNVPGGTRNSYSGNWFSSTGSNASFGTLNTLNLPDTGAAGAHTHTVTTNASNTNGCTNCNGTALDTMDPYITVYMWKRTA